MDAYEFLRSIEEVVKQIDDPRVKRDAECVIDNLRRLLMRLAPYRYCMQQPFEEAHKRILKYMIESMSDSPTTKWVVGDDEYAAFKSMAEDDENLARLMDTRIIADNRKYQHFNA